MSVSNNAAHKQPHYHHYHQALNVASVARDEERCQTTHNTLSISWLASIVTPTKTERWDGFKVNSERLSWKSRDLMRKGLSTVHYHHTETGELAMDLP